MQTAIVLPFRPLSPLRLLAAFVRWYYAEMPVRIVQAALAYAKALWEVFSFVFLLKTLFSPWKNITDSYPSKGFNLSKIAETFTLNCTARVIGFIFRVCAIVIGIVLEVVCVIVCVAWLLLWILFPLLAVLAIVFLLASLLP